jgi:choline dehydrogenase-like flavoprotein
VICSDRNVDTQTDPYNCSDMNHSHLDCLIVGGGPAGLAAAIYLGRFRRRALMIDAGQSRVKWISCIRNYPGFPDGVSGLKLLEDMRTKQTSLVLTSRRGRFPRSIVSAMASRFLRMAGRSRRPPF